jgi:hypothetical protein
LTATLANVHEEGSDLVLAIKSLDEAATAMRSSDRDAVVLAANLTVLGSPAIESQCRRGRTTVISLHRLAFEALPERRGKHGDGPSAS